uniref:Uncharacterized protein n=1 Tax=Arundo donax TaxID=35708 RepID=A0A0A8ZNJ0_ARUDO
MFSLRLNWNFISIIIVKVFYISKCLCLVLGHSKYSCKSTSADIHYAIKVKFYLVVPP